MLTPFVQRWRDAGYEMIVAADHGQDARGHHGGISALRRDIALYYLGQSAMPDAEVVPDQLTLAPSILTRMGAAVLSSMTARSFF